jgi:PDGLE domain
MRTGGMSQVARRWTTVVAFIGVGLAVALVLAFLVSPHASSSPDGLERVATDKGFSEEADDSAAADGPLAGYAVRGVDDDGLSTGLAGAIGVAVTFAVGTGLFVLMRARHRRSRPEAAT